MRIYIAEDDPSVIGVLEDILESNALGRVCGASEEGAPDPERIMALDPDLVILPLKLKDTVPALEALEIPVLLANPEDLALLAETINMLGAATGTDEAAAALLDYNARTETELTALLDGMERPVVYLAGNSSYLSTAGAKMYQNTLIELGGGVNAAAEIEDTYWAEISYEQLLTWNPEVIVIVPEAAYTREELLSDPQLSGLDAIENGAVYEMPSAFEAWDSPVPSAMLGSRWMAAVLHGDVYAFETFCADAASCARCWGRTARENPRFCVPCAA